MIQARIKSRLSDDGVSLEAVASAADVSSKTLRRLRSGSHSPTLRTINRVMTALDRLYPPVKGRGNPKREAPTRTAA